MSPPAKPGEGRAGRTPSRSRRPARKPGPEASGGAADEKPARAGKALRVRKDGSVAGGSSEARQARVEGRPAAPKTARPARARPDRSSPAPARDPTQPVRPSRASTKPERAAADAKPKRVRKDGSIATRHTPSRQEPQRIAKLLARAGVASRREIERMIEEGRIALNGQTLDTPATILTSLAGVTVDGKAVEAADAARLFLFHKPTGFLTTERDPRGRPTIYDRLPNGLPRLMPVGRLDMNTEGLLLMTNDGGLKRQLELPSSGIPRVYRARAYGEVAQEQLEALADGVEIDGMRYGSIDANMERRTGRNMWIEVKITEGKNREVRRVLEYLGLQVSRLIRVAYGPFILGDLPPGQIGEVKQHELVEFRKGLK